MQHYSGFHSTMDHRTAMPRPYISFYPAIYPQTQLRTSINMLAPDLTCTQIRTGPPPKCEPIAPRESYDTLHPAALTSFGPTTRARLGDVLLARSGDKGANANVGFFVPTALPSSYPAGSPLYAETWEWVRSFLTRDRLKALMGESWDPAFFVERVEFAHIYAVHFVVYGVLGRGVSGSSRLDALAKGIADWLRDVEVDVPVKFLEGRQKQGVVSRL